MPVMSSLAEVLTRETDNHRRCAETGPEPRLQLSWLGDVCAYTPW